MAENTITQEQRVRLAPFQEEFLGDIFASAKGLTGDGSQMPYSAQQLAGLTEAQKNAVLNAKAGVGSYEDYLTDGSAALKTGIGSIGTGMESVGGALKQLPGAQQGYQDQQTAMLAAQGLGQAGTQQAQSMTAGADYNFNPNSYQQFMNPYMNDVIQQQYRDIADQGEIQRQKLGASAVGSGAFGGSRQGVAEAELAGNVLDQQARTGSQLRSAGFQQAQGLAQQAAAAQAGQQLQQASLYGQQAGQLGAQGFQGAQGYGQAAAGLGNLAQLQGQLGQSQGQLGQATAGLGQMGQQMGVQDVNTLLGVGALGQGQAQKTLDVQRANDLARQALPYQQVGFMSDIFRGVPALQQTTSSTTTPPPSTSSQLMGLGIAGLGAYGQANQGKGFFN